MLFFFKKNKLIKRFARSTAEELYSNLPPSMLEKQYDKKNKKMARKAHKTLQDVLDDTVLSIAQFKSVNKLGIYGKAKFHLEFVERLKELGYSDQIAEAINEEILIKTP
jgi:hydrogenase maturation factor HypF (carbamoyltransferase family)